MKLRLPDSAYNMLSLVGATISVITFFMIVFLFTVSTFSDVGGAYLGILLFLVLPIFMICGLVLIPIGMIRKRRQRKEGSESRKLPYVDLNIKQHRNATIIFIFGTVLFLFISAVGSYEGFHYTESVEFCGETCHGVMEPEFIAFQDSPHSRLRCVDCHVGSGVDHYISSKLAGLRQVYKVLIDDIPRPIQTPIHNLRPARETCETCHWPQKFYPNTIREENYHLLDEGNSKWQVQLLMKIGSNKRATALDEGIHWHINPNIKIEYVHTDNKRQEIPWVRYTNLESGNVTIYEDEYNRLDKGALDSLEIRIMDCMDCHNRPSHNYQPPTFFVNEAMNAGDIPDDLPELKSLSMDICGEDFSTMDSAMIGIEFKIKEFYEDNYPEIVEDDFTKIELAIKGLQSVYKKNIFPEMKVRWSEYPLNIGHMEFDGCFRCHSDEHTSQEGKVISKDCNLCHGIIAQGHPDSLIRVADNNFLEFKHPEDIDDAWQEMFCTGCHTGLNP